MNKKFFSHAPMISNGAMVQTAGIIKPAKTTHWSLQKQVPSNILAARAESEARAEVLANRSALNEKHDAKFPNKNSRPLGLFAQTSGGKLKVLGFGTEVASVNELFALAAEHGRSFVKVDGQEVRG